MFKRMAKTMFHVPEQHKSDDQVRYEKYQARFYQNQGKGGIPFYRFSLHRVAKVKHEQRSVNSFEACDIVKLPTVAKEVALWYIRNSSTFPEQKQLLLQFVDVHSHLEYLEKCFGDKTGELLRLIVDLTKTRDQANCFIESLRTAQAQRSAKEEASRQRSMPKSKDIEALVHLMTGVLNALNSGNGISGKDVKVASQGNGPIQQSGHDVPHAKNLNGV